MKLSDDIDKYISNSKVKGSFIKWNKPILSVFITEITAQVENKNFYYSEISRAVSVWNNILIANGFSLKFELTSNPQNADIIVHWTKVGRVFEGMCKYLSVVNNEIKKVSIEVGLFNPNSPKNTTNESIFFVMMHELGHSLGLGHGVEIDDVMFVPHQKNISVPSENDLYVLKMIYNTTC